jgi:5-methylcytosine-specific restriction endonuclease McrA
MCKAEGRVTTKGTKLEVHHIKTIEEHPDLSLEEKNLSLICNPCHNREHNRFSGTKRINVWDDERW